MIAVVWQFQVTAGREREFEAFFGADGAWAALSRRSRSYLGCSFLRDTAEPNAYMLVEYWSEMLVYEKHKEDLRADLRVLEQRRDALVDFMRAVSVFTALDVPDRTGPAWSRRSGQDEP